MSLRHLSIISGVTSAHPCVNIPSFGVAIMEHDSHCGGAKIGAKWREGGGSDPVPVEPQLIRLVLSPDRRPPNQIGLTTTRIACPRQRISAIRVLLSLPINTVSVVMLMGCCSLTADLRSR